MRIPCTPKRSFPVFWKLGRGGKLILQGFRALNLGSLLHNIIINYPVPFVLFEFDLPNRL